MTHHFYNNVVHSVICEDWHITHMWTILAYPQHFTKRDMLWLIEHA